MSSLAYKTRLKTLFKKDFKKFLKNFWKSVDKTFKMCYLYNALDENASAERKFAEQFIS